MNKDFFRSTGARAGIWAAVIIAMALFFWLTAPKSASKVKPGTNANAVAGPTVDTNTVVINANIGALKPIIPTKKPAPKTPVGFTEKKTPHFVSATIANNATLVEAPTGLTLYFDAFVIKSQQSFITVKKNDIDSATINASSTDGKTMYVRLNPNAKSGDYYVYYVACFPDAGCSDGRFGYHLKLPQ